MTPAIFYFCINEFDDQNFVAIKSDAVSIFEKSRVFHFSK